MRRMLYAVAIISFLYGLYLLPNLFFGLLDLLTGKRMLPQQISDQIGVGFSLLVFSVAGGLASIIGKLERLAAPAPVSIPEQAPRTEPPLTARASRSFGPGAFGIAVVAAVFCGVLAWSYWNLPEVRLYIHEVSERLL